VFHHAALFVYNWQLVGSIEIVPAARASYSLFLRLDYSNRFAVDEGGKRILDSPRVRYPWAMAPTINTTKLVATAIATFASTDKFIILPSIMAATSIAPVFDFPFLIASNFARTDGCQDGVRSRN
jgi:hypothetical protein